jgi:pSer/pThr/pTyr-binding forkhead associated (FHA) protein
MALLQSLNGQNAGQRYPLVRDSAVLGRDPACDVIVDASAVSRRHARVFRQNDKFFVEDLNSRNGTFVNGQQVLTPRELADVQEFVGERPQADDMCLICFGRTKQ